MRFERKDFVVILFHCNKEFEYWISKSHNLTFVHFLK